MADQEMNFNTHVATEIAEANKASLKFKQRNCNFHLSKKFLDHFNKEFHAAASISVMYIVKL